MCPSTPARSQAGVPKRLTSSTGLTIHPSATPEAAALGPVSLQHGASTGALGGRTCLLLQKPPSFSDPQRALDLAKTSAILKDASDKLGCYLLLLSSHVFPSPSEEEEDAEGTGAGPAPRGCSVGGRLEGGRGMACVVLPDVPGCWKPDKDRL